MCETNDVSLDMGKKIIFSGDFAGRANDILDENYYSIVSIENFLETGEREELLLKIAKLYSRVFGVEPWNEGFICPECEKIFSSKFTGGRCDICSSELENFYDEAELVSRFEELFTNQGFNEKIAYIKKGEKIIPIGFTFWWESSLGDLNNDKLGLSVAGFSKLEGDIQSTLPDYDEENFYYFADIGVDPDFRSIRVGAELYSERISKIQSEGGRFIIGRTTKQQKNAIGWYLKNGFKIVYEYGDERERVLLVKDLLD